MLQDPQIDFSEVSNFVKTTIRLIENEKDEISFNKYLNEAYSLLDYESDDLELNLTQQNQSNRTKIELKDRLLKEYISLIERTINEIKYRFADKQELLYESFSEL